MGIFNRFKSKDLKDDSNPFSRKADESLYHQALKELESNSINKGVYAKALGDSSGDEAKARSLYIKYRVQSLDDEQSIEILEKRHSYRIKKEEERKKYWRRTRFEIIIFIILFIVLLSWIDSYVDNL